VPREGPAAAGPWLSGASPGLASVERAACSSSPRGPVHGIGLRRSLECVPAAALRGKRALGRRAPDCWCQAEAIAASAALRTTALHETAVAVGGDSLLLERCGSTAGAGAPGRREIKSVARAPAGIPDRRWQAGRRSGPGRRHGPRSRTDYPILPDRAEPSRSLEASSRHVAATTTRDGLRGAS
jgi:hypothetical protein